MFVAVQTQVVAQGSKGGRKRGRNMPQLLRYSPDKEAADTRKEVVDWIRTKYAGIKMDKAYTKLPIALCDAFKTVIMKRYRDKYEWAKDKKKINSALYVWFEDGKQRYKKQSMIKSQAEDQTTTAFNTATGGDSQTNNQSDYLSAAHESDGDRKLMLSRDANSESYLKALSLAGSTA